MLRLVGRTHHDLPGDGAVKIDTQVLLKAVESFGTARAAMAHVFVCNREAAVVRHARRDAPPPWTPVGVGLRVLRDKLVNRRHDLLHGRLVYREARLLLEPSLPTLHLLQHKAQRACPCRGFAPIQVHGGFEAAVSYQG
jgi:hypothetical protein